VTEPATPTRPRVLDAATLLALARGETYAIVVTDVILRSGGQLVVPTSAIAAAVATRPAAEPRLLALTEQAQVEVDDLTSSAGRRVGRLLASTKLPIELLPAAHVVYAATERGHCPVFAGDPEAIRRVDPDLAIDTI
jgi:hypothetical protein